MHIIETMELNRIVKRRNQRGIKRKELEGNRRCLILTFAGWITLRPERRISINNEMSSGDIERANIKKEIK